MFVISNVLKENSGSRVHCGVILAAGYGTRFLPATKTIPKEMLPIIDIPSIEYIVREFIESGITRILVITSRRKKTLEDYFDTEVELENFLDANDKSELKNKIPEFKANFFFIRQKEMLGTGDAILLAKDFTNGEPFVVAYPDDVVFANPHLSKRLIDAFILTNKNVMALDQVPASEGSRYGVVSAQRIDNQLEVQCIEEKSNKQKSGNVLISIGRYLFTSEVFDILKSQNSKQQVEGGSQTDMLNFLANNGRLIGQEFEGVRYDLGQPDGYVKAITHAALQRDDIKDEYIKYLKSLPLDE